MDAAALLLIIFDALRGKGVAKSPEIRPQRAVDVLFIILVLFVE